ncbi:MAG: heme o synthase [Burkholderiaceae bacterium]
MIAGVLRHGPVGRLFALAKPRVVALIVFCAVVGVFLASPGAPNAGLLAYATLGIALTAGSAAALNCLLEQRIDALMLRTRGRPLPSGAIGSAPSLGFAIVTCALGLWLLHAKVNPLTMWLTFATFVGYALVYTLLLKPRTSQNIVIGGATGAMPPVLGWAAATGEVPVQAWLLFLIIFVWTPPHFWSLALYRSRDYAKAGLPMLPVVRGVAHTCRVIVGYTAALVVASALPFVAGMSGWPYLVVALGLGLVFLRRALALQRDYSDARARSLFRYSIVYLSVLFAALLIDHSLR